MRYSRCAVLGLLFLFAAATQAAADDFRIQTNVYVGNSKIPVSQNTTLFRAGYVYDYMTNPQRADAVERVAVFDQGHGRFIVMDPVRKLKAEVKTDEVLLFASKLPEQVAKTSNAFTKFAADPEFETEFSQEGKLTMSSPHMTYTLNTMAANTPEAAAQYREFSDWYVRFNTMASPGATPPFARMAVNAELAERGLVPTEVHLNIPAQSGVKKATAMRSEHHVSWRLLPRDVQKIESTASQISSFKQVDFDEFEAAPLTKR